jgi:hypothetical protein
LTGITERHVTPKRKSDNQQLMIRRDALASDERVEVIGEPRMVMIYPLSDRPSERQRDHIPALFEPLQYIG